MPSFNELLANGLKVADLYKINRMARYRLTLSLQNKCVAKVVGDNGYLLIERRVLQ